MLVQNYELVGSFPTPAAGFATNNLQVNPGIAANFPWLSKIALNYSKFSWKYLRFMYVPAVSTTTAGTVFMICHYDNADSAPTSIGGVAQSNSSSLGPTWQGGGMSAIKAFRPDLYTDQGIYLDIDCKNLTQPWYYVRTAANVDADTVPLKVYYGVGPDVAAGLAPGSLYVSYICALTEPVASTENA